MKKYKWLFFIIISLYILSNPVYASDIEDIISEQEAVIDYEELQSTIDKLLNDHESGLNLDFKETVYKLIRGSYDLQSENVMKILITSIFNEVKVNIDLFVKLIAIAIIAAIFTNFSKAFENKYVGEVGYFVVFLLMASIILQSYRIINSIALNVITDLQLFIQALIPSLFAATALSGSYTTTFIFSQILLIIIGVVDNVILKFIIPFTYIIIILEIINSITDEGILSKMTELLKGIVNWGIKILMIGFIAALSLQSFTAPVLDGVTNKSVKYAVGAIPFIGSTLSGVADTVLGGAVLIKNGIGIAGLIVILFICIIPIIKIISIILLYKLSAALIQPIADKRVVTCLSNIGDISFILLGIVVITAFLFIIAISITLNATNISAYIR